VNASYSSKEAACPVQLCPSFLRPNKADHDFKTNFYRVINLKIMSPNSLSDIIE
jgi:hypothetical protein